MPSLKTVISKYDNLQTQNTKIKETVVYGIKEMVNIEIKKEQIFIENNIVKIQTNSVYKFEILQNQKQIEKELLSKGIQIK
jgi:hypothetical protein